MKNKVLTPVHVGHMFGLIRSSDGQKTVAEEGDWRRTLYKRSKNKQRYNAQKKNRKNEHDKSIDAQEGYTDTTSIPYK